MGKIICKECGTTESDVFIHTSGGSFCDKCWKTSKHNTEERQKEIDATHEKAMKLWGELTERQNWINKMRKLFSDVKLKNK